MKIKNLKLKIVLIILFNSVFFGTVIQFVHAQTATPTATPTAKPTPIKSGPTPTPNEKITELKERIASRVAELNLVEKRGLLGKIASISGTKITLTDSQNRGRLIDTDELTEGPSLTIDDTISVVGLYNKNSKILLARFIEKREVFIRIFGEVASIDKKNFTISVKDEKGQTSDIGIKTSTQTSIYDNEKLTKAGFSKIAVGQKVFAVLSQDAALRLILFPLPATPTPIKSATQSGR